MADLRYGLPSHILEVYCKRPTVFGTLQLQFLYIGCKILSIFLEFVFDESTVFELGSFYCWNSQEQADLIKSNHKAYVLQSRTFCFCAHTQNFKLLLQTFEVNFEN